MKYRQISLHELHICTQLDIQGWHDLCSSAKVIIMTWFFSEPFHHWRTVEMIWSLRIPVGAIASLASHCKWISMSSVSSVSLWVCHNKLPSFSWPFSSKHIWQHSVMGSFQRHFQWQQHISTVDHRTVTDSTESHQLQYSFLNTHQRDKAHHKFTFHQS